MRILVVEDNSNVAQGIAALLSVYHYAVDIAEDGAVGLGMAEAFTYDLMILDIGLPQLDGVSLCQQLREKGMQMPILLLTGQGGEGRDKAIALHSGADDYVEKPFDAEELIARVQTLLRRGDLKTQPILTWGPLSVDPGSGQASYGSQLLALTPKEYAILEVLLRNPHRALPPRLIVDQVWSSLDAPGEEAVRVHIKELRKKLSAVAAPKDFIKTDHRLGYRLNPLYGERRSAASEASLTPPQVAELQAVNQELRVTLEELRATQAELRQKHQELVAERQHLQAVQDDLERQVQERTHHLTQANHLLQQQQNQWQALFDHALEAILIVDDKGCYVDANPVACKLFGGAREELLGACIGDFVGPEMDFAQMWQQFLQTGQGSGELRLHCPDGTTRDTEFSAIANFVPGRHLAILRETGDRLPKTRMTSQNQPTVQERLAEIEAIYQNAPIGLGLLDQDLRFVRLNAALAAINGVPLEAHLGRPLSEVLPRLADTLEPFYQQVVDTGEPVLNVEIVGETPKYPGVEQTWLVSWFPLKDAEGTIIGINVVVQDLTERKQLERSLQESKATLSRILDNVNAAITSFRIYANRDWEYEYWSAGCETLYGYPLEVYQDKHFWLSQIVPEDRETIVMPLFDEFLAGRNATAEYRFRRKDGEIRWFSSAYTTQPVSDDCWIVTTVNHDITDRKQAELTLKKQIQQEYLLADIAQDIRQSLRLEVVLSRTVDRVRDYLDTDRVVIFRFRPDWQGEVIMESVGAAWTPILSTTIQDPCFAEQYIEPYRQGRICAVADITQTDLQPCYVELLQHFQVQANLVVPLLQGETLWGLLMAHHCAAPRPWQPAEIAMVRRLATQVGIAIQQSELYEQTQRDLLAREQMQAVLAENEERFRTLNAAAPIAICQADANGLCLYNNARWQEMSGLSFEASLGTGWLSAVHPDDQAGLSNAWNDYLQRGGDFFYEFRLLRPQGDIRWVATHAAAMKSAQGEVIGYVSIGVDITAQKRATQKIEQQTALLDIASDAIFVRDLEQRILYWNKGAERLYGWTAAEAVGQRVDDLLQCGSDLLARIAETLLEQGEWQGEIRDLTKAGTPVTVAARWTLVRDEAGQPKAILSVITDITEKKHLEAQVYQAHRLESLGRLASGIAHDLNNLLTPILTLSQLLQITQSGLTVQGREQLKLLEDSAKRGAGLVKQILTATRGTPGDPTTVDLVPLAQEVTTMLRQSFPKNIEIRADFPSQESIAPSAPAVVADPTHLHQVLMNLCVNARDAMPDGGTLTLATATVFVDEALAAVTLDAQVGHYVVITVTDTGTGIDPAVRDRIFDPFFTTKAVGKGTGLGLSTVLGLVQTYGGFVQVFSEVGQGTTVKVYFPAVDPQSLSDPSAEASPDPDPSGHGELILLVEDDAMVQGAVRSLLESQNYRVLVAHDGAEAIDRYTQHQATIHLVVSDIMMPNMDGITLITHLKRLNPALKLIALSGLPAHQDAALAAGARGFLVKPSGLETLLPLVADLITEDTPG